MSDFEQTHLPWPRLMSIAFGVLGIAPVQFWQMTPCEWMMAFEGWRELHGGSPMIAPMTHDELTELCTRFPDNVKG